VAAPSNRRAAVVARARQGWAMILYAARARSADAAAAVCVLLAGISGMRVEREIMAVESSGIDPAMQVIDQ